MGSGHQELGSASIAFPVYKQGSGLAVEWLGLESVPIRDPHTAEKGLASTPSAGFEASILKFDLCVRFCDIVPGLFHLI